jgi:Zn-dependent M32 family carboxypeptidase
MAVHESQSLLWERMVGQSRAFWKWATPIVHKYFPHTSACTPEDFYRVVNIVKPSLIRVDADEVTYPLHVIVRSLLPALLLLYYCFTTAYRALIRVDADEATYPVGVIVL